MMNSSVNRGEKEGGRKSYNKERGPLTPSAIKKDIRYSRITFPD